MEAIRFFLESLHIAISEPASVQFTSKVRSQVTPKYKKRLGELLIEAGLVTQTQVDLALREQKKRGGLIGQILVNLGFASADTISDFLAREAEAKVVNVNRYVIDKEVLQLVPFELAKRFRALP